MQTQIYAQNSMREAGRQVRLALTRPVEQPSKGAFACAGCSVANLFTGLHQSGFDAKDNGWPPVLKRFAAEPWRGPVARKLADDELFACDAQWSGLYHTMFIHMPDGTERRLKLAAALSQGPDA